MKKLMAVIIFALSFLLVACSEKCYIVRNNAPNDTDILLHNEGETEYVLNISSKVYHLPTCRNAQRIKEENRKVSDDLVFLEERGYRPCSICISSDL